METVRTEELGITPHPGLELGLPDGSEIKVSRVRHRLGLVPGRGLVPAEVELVCCKELLAGLEEALLAGWRRMDEAGGAPA